MKEAFKEEFMQTVKLICGDMKSRLFIWNVIAGEVK
jgi:hypothetical protein